MHHDRLAAGCGLIDLGGKSYLVGQCAHADLVAVRKRLKAKMPTPLTMLGRMMAEPGWKLLPADLQRELQKEAGQTQLRGESPISDDMVFDMLANDPELVALLAWTLIRKPMPSTTLEEIQVNVTQDNVTEILAKLLEQSGLGEVEKNSAGPNGLQTQATGASA